MRRPTQALLVDHNAETRHMYAWCLARTACEVDQATEGREALVKALTRHHDVIVTEAHLPGIDGFDLCRLLRADEFTRQLPIILVTSGALENDLTRARHAGADVVLPNPCLPEQLASEIRRMLSLSHELRARSRAAQERASAQLARSDAVVQHSRETVRRVMLSHAFNRRETTRPPVHPPAVCCPECNRPLEYRNSHLGGVSARHSEQWDYFECSHGCGTYQFRQRTRVLRRVG